MPAVPELRDQIETQSASCGAEKICAKKKKLEDNIAQHK